MRRFSRCLLAVLLAAGCLAVSVPAAVPAEPGSGYWMLSADGHVYGFGSAIDRGEPLGAARADIEPSPSGDGYWVLAEDGAVFAYGDARRAPIQQRTWPTGTSPATARMT